MACKGNKGRVVADPHDCASVHNGCGHNGIKESWHRLNKPPLWFVPFSSVQKRSPTDTSSRVDTTHWRSRTYKYVFKSEGEGSLGGRVHVGVNGGLCGARTGSPTQPRENYSTNEWAFVYFFFFWKSFPFDIAGDMIYLRFNTYVKIWRKIMRCFQ